MTSEKAPERDDAKRHALALEQCAIFAQDVGSDIAKAMQEAAAYLRSSADVADAMVAAAWVHASAVAANTPMPMQDTANASVGLPSAGTQIGKLIADCTPSEARAALAEAERKAWEAGRDAAKALIQKELDDYVKECGMYDHTTGVTEFPGTGEEWVHDQEERIEAIAALKKEPKP